MAPSQLRRQDVSWTDARKRPGSPRQTDSVGTLAWARCLRLLDCGQQHVSWLLDTDQMFNCESDVVKRGH